MDPKKYDIVIWYYDTEICSDRLEHGPLPEEVTVVAPTPWQAKRMAAFAFENEYPYFLIKDIDSKEVVY